MSDRPEMNWRLRDSWRVYRAVRKAELGWWRAVGVLWRIRRTGKWSARNAGELRAQLLIVADATRPEDA